MAESDPDPDPPASGSVDDGGGDKQFLVFTDGGKPVYARHGDGLGVASVCAALHALVSATRTCVGGEPQAMVAGPWRLAFAFFGPFCLVAATRTRETPRALATQLAVLHRHLLCHLTQRIHDHLRGSGASCDVRSLLAGTAPVTDRLIQRLPSDPGPAINAIPCLRLLPQLRCEIADILCLRALPHQLAAVVFAGPLLVQLVTSKHIALDPLDVLLLANFVAATRPDPGTTHYAPICLPKYNSQGMVSAFLHPLPMDAGADDTTGSLCLVLLMVAPFLDDAPVPPPIVGAVDTILADLRRSELLAPLAAAARTHALTPRDLGLAGHLTHALYYHRRCRQYIETALPAPESVHGCDPPAGIATRRRWRLLQQYSGLRSPPTGAEMRPAVMTRVRRYPSAVVVLRATAETEIFACCPPVPNLGDSLDYLDDVLDTFDRWVTAHHASLFFHNSRWLP